MLGVAYLISVLLALPVLDFFWLNLAMNRFYLEQTAPVARLKDGSWDVLLWAAAFVYLFLALGVQYFCIKPGRAISESFFRGALFGLCTYALYEFTNLAMVKSWSLEMAFVDLGWGVVLCGVGATIGQLVTQLTVLSVAHFEKPLKR